MKVIDCNTNSIEYYFRLLWYVYVCVCVHVYVTYNVYMYIYTHRSIVYIYISYSYIHTVNEHCMLAHSVHRYILSQCAELTGMQSMPTLGGLPSPESFEKLHCLKIRAFLVIYHCCMAIGIIVSHWNSNSSLFSDASILLCNNFFCLSFCMLHFLIIEENFS